MTCRYLEGEKLDISTIAKRKALIGKSVEYLRRCDIDRSGRGYFFPRIATVVAVFGKNIEFDNGSIEPTNDIVEMRFIA